MKKKIKLAGFAIALLGLLSFSNPPSASIKGKVTPADYAVEAWAISATDTLYTTVDNGHFEFYNVEPGTYRVIVGAASPYRHLAKDNVEVSNGQSTDIGELALEKYVVILK